MIVVVFGLNCEIEFLRYKPSTARKYSVGGISQTTQFEVFDGGMVPRAIAVGHLPDDLASIQVDGRDPTVRRLHEGQAPRAPGTEIPNHKVKRGGFARSESRGHELAIRQALGAGRGRLVRHTFAESLLLGTVGAGAGLWISTWVVPALASMGADHIPRTGAWQVDGSVIGFAAMLALVTSVLFGLAPALSGSRSLQNLADRGGSVSRTRVRVRNALLVTQMAVTVVLLIGAGVLTRNLMSLMQVDPGFDPDNVVTMTFALDVSRYESQASMADFHRRLGERIRALPAATDAGSIRSLPLATDGRFETVSATGARLEADEHINTLYQVTSPGYFEALSVPIVNGRPLALTDVDGSEPVVVINQAMADRYWPDGRALGNRVQLGAFPENTIPKCSSLASLGTSFTVVSVRNRLHRSSYPAPRRARCTVASALALRHSSSKERRHHRC